MKIPEIKPYHIHNKSLKRHSVRLFQVSGRVGISWFFAPKPGFLGKISMILRQ